jgi:hypothetical protein
MEDKDDPQLMLYFSFSATHPGGGVQGRVCRFEKDARDRLFKDPGLVKEVAKLTREKIGCGCYTFHPAIELKPGVTITITD